MTEFQVFLDGEVQKILKPSSTRWLSLEACIARILDQWGSLQLCFNHAFYEEGIQAAGPLLAFVSSPKQKIVLLFRDFVLPKVNSLNKFFQKKATILHEIQHVVTSCLERLLDFF